VLANSSEVVTVNATVVPSTVNYDVTTQSVIYYTGGAGGSNWTVNFRASSGTTLNTALATGRSVTVALMATQNATPYYNNVIQVDGNTITPKYQGGIAWTGGNASGIDVYVYTIIKTASAPFLTVTLDPSTSTCMGGSARSSLSKRVMRSLITSNSGFSCFGAVPAMPFSI